MSGSQRRGRKLRHQAPIRFDKWVYESGRHFHSGYSRKRLINKQNKKLKPASSWENQQIRSRDILAGSMWWRQGSKAGISFFVAW